MGVPVYKRILDLFEAEDVRADAVIVGHVDENPDIRHLDALCARGAFVQFDVIGKEHFLLDATRARLLLRLVERGWTDRLLLSTDRARPTDLRRQGARWVGLCPFHEERTPSFSVDAQEKL